eukprot:351612-Chlamydomonas_euryale.AAC.19
MEHATATFSDAVPTPCCGMYTNESHTAFCRADSPCPSLPRMNAVGPAKAHTQGSVRLPARRSHRDIHTETVWPASISLSLPVFPNMCCAPAHLRMGAREQVARLQ